MVSASIGSSWTVVGTIGIGLMGIAINMELSPAITAAAIISGAYFGDTTSPLSDSSNLAAATGGVDLYKHVKETLLTSSIALVIALAVFLMLGRPGDFDASAQDRGDPELVRHLAGPVPAARGRRRARAVQGPAVHGDLPRRARRRRPRRVRGARRVVTFATRAGDDIPRWLALVKGVWLALASGYTGSTGIPMIDQLVTRGGMASMLNTIWLIITALAFGGVVEKAGVLDRLITPVIESAKSAGRLVSTLVASVIGTNIVTADQ